MKPDFFAKLRTTALFRAKDPLDGARIEGNSASGLPDLKDEEPGPRPALTPRATASPPDPAETSSADMSGPAQPARAIPRDGPEAATRRRRPLGVTLRLLEEGRSAAFAPPAFGRPTRAPDIPEGAMFEARAFACAEGSRDYKLYVPSRADEGLRGLVVMLHGCKQDSDDFAVGTGMNRHAERERLLVAYPCQATAHNALRCWNWFNPDDQLRDAGEPAIIAGITRSLLAEFPIEHDRSMVAGLSAGGSMAAVLGATYPDLFGTIGIHSGLPYGSARDAATAFAVMRGEPGDGPHAALSSRTIVFHGDADRTVHPENASRILAAAGPGEIRSHNGSSPAGRPFRLEALVDARGAIRHELWMVEGAGHAWFGGDPTGSYTDPDAPDASAEMVRFFLRGPR